MCAHEESMVYCTTHLCLTVNKSKEEKNKLAFRCQCYVVYILSTVETEDTYTPARLKALLPGSQSSVHPVTCSPSFLESDCVRGPSKNFVKRSAVLFFVSTRPTDGPFSLIHCCIAKQRI